MLKRHSPRRGPAKGILKDGYAGLDALPVPKTRIAAPQEPVREQCGYAVTFCALAALLAGTPPQVSAANYTTGTHQAAVANSQSPGFVRGTNPSLFGMVQGCTVVVAPEQVESGYTRFWSAPPTPVLNIRPPVTLVSSPQQIDDSYARVSTPNVTLIPPPQVVGGVNYTVGTHRIDDGAYYKTGVFVPSVVVGTDTILFKTRISAPEQIDSSAAWIFKPSTTLIPPPQTVGGISYTVGTHRQDNALFVRIGRFVEPAAPGVDVRGPHTIQCAPQQIDTASAKVFTTPSALIPEPITIFRYFQVDQESTEHFGTSVWGTFVAAPLGTDKPIGHFTAYFEPFYEPVQVGIVYKPNTDLIPPPAISPIPDFGPLKPAGRIKKRRYEVEIDGQVFEVESPTEAIVLLDKARALATERAPVFASVVVEQKLKDKPPIGKPIRVPAPQISTPNDELANIVIKARHDIARVYREAALAAEIRLRLQLQQKQQDEDEDDVLSLLL